MMQNLLTIEDSTIKSMMADPRIVTLLPCLVSPRTQLESVAKGGSRCSTCSYKKKNIARSAMQAAKQCIKSAKGQTLRKLKEILQVKQLRLILKNSKGASFKYTF